MSIGHTSQIIMQFLVLAILFLAVAQAQGRAGWYYCHGQKNFHQSRYKYAPAKIANIDYGKTKIRYLTKREAEADPAVCTPYPTNIKTEDFNYGPTKIKYFGKGKDTENEVNPNFEIRSNIPVPVPAPAPKEKRKENDLPVMIFQGRPFSTASFLKKTIDQCLEDNCPLPQLLSKLVFFREDNQPMPPIQRRQSEIMKAIVPVLKKTILPEKTILKIPPNPQAPAIKSIDLNYDYWPDYGNGLLIDYWPDY